MLKFLLLNTIVQKSFGGADRRVSACDGTIFDMTNMTSDYYPVLSTRGLRALYEDYNVVMSKLGMDWEDGIAKTLMNVCDVSDVPYYVFRYYNYESQIVSLSVAMVNNDGEVKNIKIYEKSAPTYSDAVQCFDRVQAVAFNNKMLVIHNEFAICVYYDGNMLVHERIDYSWLAHENDMNDAMLWHTSDRTYLQIKLKRFTIEDLIHQQDTLCVRDPGYVAGRKETEYYLTVINKSHVQDLDEDECLLLECELNSDVGASRDPDDDKEYDPSTSYTYYSIMHKVPHLEHVCVCRDRIWGTIGNEIYSCSSGEYRNWYRYDNTAADSFYAEIGAVSCFTGIASYAGSVYFFTREDVYRMYGTTPDAFSLVALGTYGIEESESRSFAVASQTMFYNSAMGPVCFNGSNAVLIGSSLGLDAPKNVVGAGVGSKYYMAKEDKLYVYDARYGTWQIHSVPMNIFDIGVFGGRVIVFEGLQAEYLDKTEGEEISPFDNALHSRVEFADISEGGIYGVCPMEFTLLASLEEGAELSLSISCNGGEFTQLWSTTETGKHIHSIRFSPKTRCDYYRLRLDGVGEWKLYSLARSYSVNASTPYGE